jgi:hypothetical protein
MIELTKEIQDRTDFICNMIVNEKQSYESKKKNGMFNKKDDNTNTSTDGREDCQCRVQ